VARGERFVKASKGSGSRELKTRVKTGKNRSLSSKLWLERQLNDPYVARAKREGYRARAVYKLMEIDDKARHQAAGASSRPSASARPTARAVRRAGWSRSTFWRWMRSQASKSCISIFSIQPHPMS
jgi:hypothetical protein